MDIIMDESIYFILSVVIGINKTYQRGIDRGALHLPQRLP